MSESVNDPAPLPEGAPDDPLTGHDYDGIQEYDNPLPAWWKWTFVITILFTPLYFFFYHSGAEGRSLADRYDRELAQNLQLQFAEIGELTADRETVLRFLYKDSWLQVGKVVFKSNCVSCHGKDGGGAIGPNLTDDQYKNVQDIGDILRVLQNGANAGAMPAWKNRLSTNEIVLVSSYVASLRGTTPEVAKDPEGRVIAPWPEQPPETDVVEETEDDTEQDNSQDDAQDTSGGADPQAEGTPQSAGSSDLQSSPSEASDDAVEKPPSSDE